MKKVEYSQIVRRKLKVLRKRLIDEFGSEVSKKVLKEIMDAAKGLGDFAEKGISVASMYDIDCDYRYLYVGHNYLFYRIEGMRLSLLKCLIRGKILCISCLAFLQYRRSRLITGMSDNLGDCKTLSISKWIVKRYPLHNPGWKNVKTEAK